MGTDGLYLILLGEPDSPAYTVGLVNTAPTVLGAPEAAVSMFLSAIEKTRADFPLIAVQPASWHGSDQHLFHFTRHALTDPTQIHLINLPTHLEQAWRSYLARVTSTVPAVPDLE